MTSAELFWTVTFPVTVIGVESWQVELIIQSPESGMQETHSSIIEFTLGVVP